MPIKPDEATSIGVRKGSAPHPPPHDNTQLVTIKQLTNVTNRPTNTTRRGLDYAPPKSSELSERFVKHRATPTRVTDGANYLALAM